MKELYVLTGLPFSGKTTFVEKVLVRKPVELVSFDAVRHREEVNIDTFPKDKILQWEVVQEASQNEVARVLKIGQSVVFDGVNPAVVNRNDMAGLINPTDGRSILVYIDTPIDVIYRRIKANERHPIRSGISLENFELIRANYEIPIESESVHAFKPLDDIDNLLRELSSK